MLHLLLSVTVNFVTPRFPPFFRLLFVHVHHYFTYVRIHNLHQRARLRLGDSRAS